MLDAVLASMATFGAGITAVVLLGDAERGVYGLFFTAFQLATVLPRNLVYTPAEVVAVARVPADRLRQMGHGVVAGWLPAFAGLLAIPLAVILARAHTSTDVITALALPAVVASVLSPAQDHARRLLHIAGRSWSAAAVSAVQLVVVGCVVAAARLLDLSPAWIPFGSLAAANAASLTVALLVAGVGRIRQVRDGLGLRQLAESGRWLVVRAIVPSAAAFAAAAIITGIAGAGVYGFAEAARQVAQPVLVLAGGLTLVLGPRVTEAAQQLRREAARRTNSRYLVMMGLFGGVYLLATGPVWWGNVMARLVPAAYEVRGLVAISIIANLVGAASYVYVHEILGAARSWDLARVSFIATPFALAMALTAGATGAFARPAGLILSGAVRLVAYTQVLSAHYRGQGVMPDTVTSPHDSDTVGG